MFWACFKFGYWGDMVKNVRFLKDNTDTTYEIPNLIKRSPKRDAMLQKIRKDISLEYPGFRVLRPTRWKVRAESMKSILDYWVALQHVWDEYHLMEIWNQKLRVEL